MNQQASEDAANAATLVTVTDNVDHEQQESIKIATPAATYYYHKAGAGLASLEDRDGNDWIGYHPGGRSAGEFRGIPNLVHPEGYFHPGGTQCETTIVEPGPVKASLESQSKDGKWAVRWDIFPTFARLTVLKAPKEYWFLYEGTPGGKLDESGDRCTLSDGRTISAGERWDTRLDPPRWVYFRDGQTGRIIYLIHHEDDGDADSYWPMEHNMTVFGFGRIKLISSLRRTPARFTIGLAEPSNDEQASRIIHAAIEALEVRPGGS